MMGPAATRRAARATASTALFAVGLAAVIGLSWAANALGPDKSQPCGTLDLDHPATQHCFPFDGSHHCMLATRS